MKYLSKDDISLEEEAIFHTGWGQLGKLETSQWVANVSGYPKDTDTMRPAERVQFTRQGATAAEAVEEVRKECEKNGWELRR